MVRILDATVRILAILLAVEPRSLGVLARILAVSAPLSIRSVLFSPPLERRL